MVLACLFIVFSIVFGVAVHVDVYFFRLFVHGFVSGVGSFLIGLALFLLSAWLVSPWFDDAT